MAKIKRKFIWLKGDDMPFTAFGYETGVWGMYYAQTRHRWFGIKGLFGLRITKEWGSNWR